MTDLRQIAARVQAAFERVHRNPPPDAAANPDLRVEVVDAAACHDATAVVLVTPGGLDGLVFTPDGKFPDRLVLGQKRHAVSARTVDGLGPHHVVRLAPDGAVLVDQETALAAGAAIAPVFREAVGKARTDATVADPERRRLFGLTRDGG